MKRRWKIKDLENAYKNFVAYPIVAPITPGTLLLIPNNYFWFQGADGEIVKIVNIGKSEKRNAS